MNSKLDILIEKYLDGNISKKDQTELNNLIGNDIESKNSFQYADALQKLIKQDAVGIEYPEELFSDVQDLILMKYLQEAPQESTVFVDLKSAYPKQLYTYVRYAAVIAIFFLASIISINEFMPLYNSKLGVKEVVSNSSGKNSNLSIGKTNIQNAGLISSINIQRREAKASSKNTQKNESNTASIASNVIPATLIGSGTLATESVENTITQETPQLITQSEFVAEVNEVITKNIDYNNKSNSKEAYNSLNELRFPNNNERSNEFRDMNQLNFVPAYNFGLEDFGLNKINFVASAANGFASFGLQLSDNKITSYSQSISYNIDKKSVMGIELGLTEFSAKVLRDVVLVMQDNSGSGDDFTGKDLFKTKKPFKQKMQLVWTTIFYERAIFQMKNSELSARVGLGLTDSDPVFMAKILGKQRIYRDLFLTVGVDTRYYKTSINGTINGNYLSTFNIIYGLQYSL
ncbi:MAG: hypothetical protein WCR42_13485 [bacterium]